jgi:hypothetical protein
MVALNAFYTAPEYQPLIPLRQSAVDMDKERRRGRRPAMNPKTNAASFFDRAAEGFEGGDLKIQPVSASPRWGRMCQGKQECCLGTAARAASARCSSQMTGNAAVQNAPIAQNPAGPKRA